MNTAGQNTARLVCTKDELKLKSKQVLSMTNGHCGGNNNTKRSNNAPTCTKLVPHGHPLRSVLERWAEQDFFDTYQSMLADPSPNTHPTRLVANPLFEIENTSPTPPASAFATPNGSFTQRRNAKDKNAPASPPPDPQAIDVFNQDVGCLILQSLNVADMTRLVRTCKGLRGAVVRAGLDPAAWKAKVASAISTITECVNRLWDSKLGQNANTRAAINARAPRGLPVPSRVTSDHHVQFLWIPEDGSTPDDAIIGYGYSIGSRWDDKRKRATTHQRYYKIPFKHLNHMKDKRSYEKGLNGTLPRHMYALEGEGAFVDALAARLARGGNKPPTIVFNTNVKDMDGFHVAWVPLPRTVAMAELLDYVCALVNHPFKVPPPPNTTKTLNAHDAQANEIYMQLVDASYDELLAEGGGTATATYRKTEKRVCIGNSKVRVVYKGPRGREYVCVKGEHVPLSQARKRC